MASDKAGIKNETYIIFASDYSDNFTRMALASLDIKFKQLLGRWKGQDEISFIVNERDMLACVPLIEKQDAVLRLSAIQDNGERKAVLLSRVNGEIIEKDIGFFSPVTKEEAEKSEGYTYDPSIKQYYVAKGE